MTDSSSPSPVGSYERTLVTLGRKWALPVEPAKRAPFQPVGCPSPVVDDTMPLDVARWAAAHEMAHISARHSARVPRGSRLAKVVLIVGLLGLVVGAGLSPRGLLWAWLVAGVIWTLLLYAASRGFIAAETRRMEEEADRITYRWGFPFSVAVAAFLSSRQKPWERWFEFATLTPNPYSRITVGEVHPGQRRPGQRGPADRRPGPRRPGPRRPGS